MLTALHAESSDCTSWRTDSCLVQPVCLQPSILKADLRQRHEACCTQRHVRAKCPDQETQLGCCTGIYRSWTASSASEHPLECGSRQQLLGDELENVLKDELEDDMCESGKLPCIKGDC